MRTWHTKRQKVHENVFDAHLNLRLARKPGSHIGLNPAYVCVCAKRGVCVCVCVGVCAGVDVDGSVGIGVSLGVKVGG